MCPCDLDKRPAIALRIVIGLPLLRAGRTSRRRNSRVEVTLDHWGCRGADSPIVAMGGSVMSRVRGGMIGCPCIHVWVPRCRCVRRCRLETHSRVRDRNPARGLLRMRCSPAGHLLGCRWRVRIGGSRLLSLLLLGKGGRVRRRTMGPNRSTHVGHDHSLERLALYVGWLSGEESCALPLRAQALQSGAEISLLQSAELDAHLDLAIVPFLQSAKPAPISGIG
mmetsp:Transcript_122911/g.347449  ORF Transcript_122911/g.347449 Transcript_122911/m.347449 type:complete len:223 (+) Transcript_122911:214-882(+)